jgi:hypothetical protein
MASHFFHVRMHLAPHGLAAPARSQVDRAHSDDKLPIPCFTRHHVLCACDTDAEAFSNLLPREL